jgi:adenosylcobinamide-GDP ribazoletransferase
LRRNRLPDSARLALGTFTVVPVPPPTSVGSAVAGRAMLLAPLAALVPALTAAVGFAVGSLVLPPLVVGALTVGLLGLASRGLHIDGLADTADGLASGHDRERALAVMRAGNTGPAGSLTLVVVVLIQAASVAALPPSWRGAMVLAAAVVVSRSVLANVLRHRRSRVPGPPASALLWQAAVRLPAAVALAVAAAVGAALGTRLGWAAVVAWTRLSCWPPSPPQRCCCAGAYAARLA